VSGRNPRLLRSGRQDEDFYRAMWADLEQSGQWQGDLWNRRRNGEVFPVRQTISAIRDAQGNVSHYVSVFHDISQRVKQEEKIRHQAYHDPLTGLPNRLLFHDRLNMALAEARRHERYLGVMFLDLIRFKQVNDTYGHLVGDRLLQNVAQRLSACIREEDTASRLAGDEFTLLLPNLRTPQDAAVVADSVIQALAAPVEIDECQIQVETSIGIACFPGDGNRADDLIERADAAMYEAKSGSKSGYAFASQRDIPSSP